ncbi:hypothetical protein AB0J21_07540 [Streptomyces sp. NPDC049954]|uniref:hypothetical protein n=1 Tax=Streptomyces sp. NPDC049954 TaxID=3155779 RepID=UPI00342D7953
MLHAKRIRPPSQEYEFTEDGRALTTLTLRGGGFGARFTLHGVDYLVRTHRFSGVYALHDATGTAVATTDRVRRRWNITSPGRVVRFRRTAAADREYTMLGEDGEPAGTIRRTGHVHTEATADLPGLEPALQVFALLVVLLRRRRKRTAAAVRSTSLTGG